MGHPDSHSSFQLLLDRALQDYEKQTGIRLQDHPLTRQIEACDSVDSIAAIIQVQGQAFREFRGGGGKVMKSLKGSVHVLYAIFTITAIGEDACQVRQEALVPIPCPSCSFYSHSSPGK
jgi:hypothetical protein